MRIITTRFVLLIAALLALNFSARATEALPPSTYCAANISSHQQDGWATIKTDEGILFVWNVRGLYFTIAVKGRQIKPLENPEHIFFTVDGRVLQIQVAAIKEFAPEAREKKLDDKSILAAHRDWEAKYIEELVHSKLKVQTFNAKLSNGSDASMWQFDMPEGMNSQAQKHVYLSVVSKDYVLLLNSEATATVSDTEGRKFLLDTIGSLKVSPTPIDVKQLSESIRAGTKP